MEKQYDILATLYLNDTEDGELMEKVRDIFSIDVEPSESVLESFKDTVLEEMRKKCVINYDALDIDVVYRLDLVYLQDDEDTDEEDGE